MNRKLIIVGTIAILTFGATYIWGATYIFLGSAPNSTTSSRSGAILRPITSPTRPSPTSPR